MTSSVSDEPGRPRVIPYLLDLDDPEHPRVIDVPRIAGYKGTLHAAGDGRLLAGTSAKGTRPAEVRLVDPAGTPGPGLAARRNRAPFRPGGRRWEAPRARPVRLARRAGRRRPGGCRTVVVTPTAMVLLDAETLRVIRTAATGPGPVKGGRADCG